MKLGDNVRIVTKIPTIDTHFLQHVGECVAVEPNGDVRYTDWQKQIDVIIPAIYTLVEANKDVKGQELVKGDKVWLSVKNEMKLAEYVGPSNWKHHGCGWMELGAQFIMDGGKKFSQYHPKGRLKA